jgi:hypothetical protein
MPIKHAFKAVCDEVKTKEDIRYERNTARKQLSDMTEQRDNLEIAFTKEMKSRIEFIKQVIITTNGKLGKDEMWKYYEDHTLYLRIHSKKLCGGKTHKGIHLLKGKDIEAHITENGSFYKKWDEKDEPTYYMKQYHINKTNFTIDDTGELHPIKKYT